MLKANRFLKWWQGFLGWLKSPRKDRRQEKSKEKVRKIAIWVQAFLPFLPLAVSLLSTNILNGKDFQKAVDNLILNGSQQTVEGLIVSPDKKKILLIINRDERPELWVLNVDGTGKQKISKLRKDEGVMSPIWSPDGALIAFVSYNLAGHSPMTTMHVWVVRSDGSGLKRVILPKPYERFSTYSPEWKTNEILILKAVTVAGEIRYTYNYKTGKMEKLDLEQKK